MRLHNIKNREIIVKYLSILIILTGLIGLHNNPIVGESYNKHSNLNSAWNIGVSEKVNDLVLDSSGNIYISGTLYKTGKDDDIFLAKFDTNGNFKWNRTWGYSQIETQEGLATDALGNIYLTGFSFSFNSWFIVKYNSSGSELWSQTWNNFSAYDVVIDSSNNILIAGGLDDDAFLAKFNSLGKQQWNKSWNYDEDFTLCYDIALDRLNNIYITGTTGNSNVFLTKLNNTGVEEWNITWGGGNSDRVEGIALDNSSNIYIAGYTTSFGAGSRDGFLVKFNNLGVQEWNTTWGGIGYDVGHNVAVDKSNNAYITGVTDAGAGSYSGIFAKYDTLGVQKWRKRIESSFWDYTSGIAIDNLKNIYLTGKFNSEILLAKYSSTGSLIWIEHYLTESPVFLLFIPITILSTLCCTLLLALSLYVQHNFKITPF